MEKELSADVAIFKDVSNFKDLSKEVSIDYELDIDPKSIWITAAPSSHIKESYVYLQECGKFYSYANHYTKRGSGLQSYLIQCTLSGEGTLEYNNRKYRLTPGHFFWIDCRHPQYYYTNKEVGIWHTIWVHFYGANSSEYYKQFISLNNGSCIALQPSDNTIANYIQKLINIYSNHKNHIIDDIYISGLLTMIMAECINSLSFDHNINVKVPDFIKDAQDYLTKNYTKKITLDDLSFRYNINKYYFQKLFKRYTKYTPNQFLTYIRLNRAKELLRTTTQSISEISFEVGINNVNHFINLFKRQEGITPNAFRKMWHNNQ